MNMHHTKVCCTLLSVFLPLLVLCSLLAAPAIGVTEAAYDTAGDALIVKEERRTEWTQLSQLNIFRQQAGDAAVIAPTSSGSYTFIIENSARFPFIYSVKITDENLAQIPMQFRLRNHEGTYIIGSETEWVPISSLKNIGGELDYESSTEYTLDWMWPGADNESDTASGVLAQDGAVYTLNFNIHAEQSGAAIDPDGPAQTGDTTALSLFISLMFISLIVLAALLIPVLISKRRQS